MNDDIRFHRISKSGVVSNWIAREYVQKIKGDRIVRIKTLDFGPPPASDSWRTSSEYIIMGKSSQLL